MLLVFNSDNLHIQVFLVTGGLNGSNYLDSTEVFDPSVGSWTAGARLPRPMWELRATYIADQVLIFGEGHFILFTNMILWYFQVALMVTITTPSFNTTSLGMSSQMLIPCWRRGVITPSAWSSSPTFQCGVSDKLVNNAMLCKWF